MVINAVDACDAGGDVTVEVRRAEMAGGPAAEIIVTDTGRGIDPEKLPRIFDPYVTSKAGGTGLGLAIVRQTVLAHNGRVDATSVPGSGTSIRMILPATPEADPSRSLPREADPSLRSG